FEEQVPCCDIHRHVRRTSSFRHREMRRCDDPRRFPGDTTEKALDEKAYLVGVLRRRVVLEEQRLLQSHADLHLIVSCPEPDAASSWITFDPCANVNHSRRVNDPLRDAVPFSNTDRMVWSSSSV